MPTTTPRSPRPAGDDGRVDTAARAVPHPSGDHAAGDPRTFHDQDGSMVSEYGLVAVLGATIVGIAISWAQGGAITTLLSAVLRQVRAVIGA